MVTGINLRSHLNPQAYSLSPPLNVQTLVNSLIVFSCSLGTFLQYQDVLDKIEYELSLPSTIQKELSLYLSVA